jgi:hypothetical protein
MAFGRTPPAEPGKTFELFVRKRGFALKDAGDRLATVHFPSVRGPATVIILYGPQSETPQAKLLFDTAGTASGNPAR